jgi:membrane-bound lytic murein transglycosylase B
MIKKIILILALILSQTVANDDREPIAYDYLSKPQVKRFISMMHKRYGFDRDYLKRVLRQARLDRDTLARYSGKFKKNSTIGSWERFKLHVVNQATFNEAKEFKHQHYKTLKKAQQRYRVDMDYIVGFLGVESHFGNYMGDYNILDALATLAFHPNRMQKFFKQQLRELFLFAKERRYDITKLQGSFAGAMGCVQQVPSIARRFNYDFDGDGASVWDIDDCIGSIAKFMHTHKWRANTPAAIQATTKSKRVRLKGSFRKPYSLNYLKKYGIKPTKPFRFNKAYLIKVNEGSYDRVWLGTPNFRVLTRYNASSNYGLAIHLIAQSLKGKQ